MVSARPPADFCTAVAPTTGPVQSAAADAVLAELVNDLVNDDEVPGRNCAQATRAAIATRQICKTRRDLIGLRSAGARVS
jgi:hypothetical protein